MKTMFGFAGAAALAAVAGLPAPALALTFDQNITAIFGSGNGDTNWTVDEANGIELGLRGKIRYDPSDNQPKNIFNSNGAGDYLMPVGSPASHPGVRGRWNVEFSINSGAAALERYNYIFGFDTNPNAGKSFSSFNVMTNGVHFDHALGTNATPNGGGVEAASPAALLALLDDYNIAQNSWNMAFLTLAYDPDIDGTYSFYLEARDKQTDAVLARSDIDIIVGAGGADVPVPASLALLAPALLGLGLVRRRKPA